VVLWPFLSYGFSIKYIHSFIHSFTLLLKTNDMARGPRKFWSACKEVQHTCYSAPSSCERSTVTSVFVCFSVCLSLSPIAYPRTQASKLRLQLFRACYSWLWLGPPLAALRYVMYFRVFFWMTTFMFADNRPGKDEGIYIK